MKKLAFILLIVGIALPAIGQDSIIIPPEFNETNLPKVNSSEWYSLNHSGNEFEVKIQDGKLEVEKVDEINVCELETENGLLRGINRGEWGGQLTYIPNDTTKSSVDIKAGNIKFLFKYNNEIYFIEGLAHLSYSGGAIFKLDSTEQGFTYKKIVDFNDSPEAFQIYNDMFLIASHSSFYIVKDFKKELVFKDTFWSSLYPNSIAAFDDKNIFLGIRGGIVKLDLITKKMKFYQYNN